MLLKAIINGNISKLIVIENHLWKECEYKQYNIVDIDKRISIISCSFCHLQVILEEKKIFDYRILEVISNDKNL